MTVTVKLDAQLEEQLRQRAAGSGRSTSEVVRAALQAYLAQPDARAAPRSAFDLGADLFGRHAEALMKRGLVDNAGMENMNQSLRRIERYWTEQIRYIY